MGIKQSSTSRNLVTRRLPVVILLAAVVASTSGSVGLYVSYYAGVASSAAIVLTRTAFFLVVWLVKIFGRRRLRAG